MPTDRSEPRGTRESPPDGFPSTYSRAQSVPVPSVGRTGSLPPVRAYRSLLLIALPSSSQPLCHRRIRVSLPGVSRLFLEADLPTAVRMWWAAEGCYRFRRRLREHWPRHAVPLVPEAGEFPLYIDRKRPERR